MKNKTKIFRAIVLAGGISKRFNSKLPKQMVRIDNKPLLAYALDILERCRPIDSIILVINKKFVHLCHNMIKKYGYKKIEQLCLGGRTRQASVFNALKKIKDCDYVIIHDGVRPLVSRKIILKTIKAVRKFGAVTCAVKATDTIVEAEKDFIKKTLSRDKLWHIQTPQGFRFNLIFKAHKKAKVKGIFNASDDAQLLLRLRKRVKLIEGSFRNIKVTKRLDLVLAKRLME